MGKRYWPLEAMTSGRSLATKPGEQADAEQDEEDPERVEAAPMPRGRRCEAPAVERRDPGRRGVGLAASTRSVYRRALKSMRGSTTV